MPRWYIADNDGIECSIRDFDDLLAAGLCGEEFGEVAQHLTPEDAALIVSAVNYASNRGWSELEDTARSFVSAVGHGRLNWSKVKRLCDRFQAVLHSNEDEPPPWDVYVVVMADVDDHNGGQIIGTFDSEDRAIAKAKEIAEANPNKYGVPETYPQPEWPEELVRRGIERTFYLEVVPQRVVPKFPGRKWD